MLKQSLQQKLQQKLSPQQIQLMKLIQLPTQAFEQRLAQEIEENPALEKGKEENDEFPESNEQEYDDTGNETIETEINIDDYLSDDEIPSYKLQSNNFSHGREHSSHSKDQPHEMVYTLYTHIQLVTTVFTLVVVVVPDFYIPTVPIFISYF